MPLSVMVTCLVKPDRRASLYVIPSISPSGVLCHYHRLTKQMEIEASEFNDSYRKPSKLTDSVRASQALTQSPADAYGLGYPRGRLVCASLFQSANLLLFTPSPTTWAPFNLHCCSRSLFQSAVVLIASPWLSQLPLLPEKCGVSLNEENRQDAIHCKERRIARVRMRSRE